MRANQRANFRTLRNAGVKLAIGSDAISGERTFATARDEVKFLAVHDLADNLSILRMWAVETPRTIFPQRMLGALDPGYEASFLVLGGDPVADLMNLERIAMRVKQGIVLPPMAGPVILKRN
jgi:imidazolonepropionase-like amidohydrolase